MNSTPIPRKQLRSAALTALLSPLLRTAPRMPVLIAGREGWLCALAAAPVLLLFARLMDSMSRAMRPGEGLAGLIRRVLGPLWGRALLLLWGGWLLFYAGFILHSGAVRLTAAVYQQSRPAPFILILLALSFTAALGGTGALVRTGTALRAVLLAVLGLTLALALPDVSAKNLLPLSLRSGPDILRGSLPVMAVGGTGAVFFFLEGYTEADGPGPSRFTGPVLLIAGVTGLLCMEAAGVFGPALTARLSYPYFTMIRDISLSGLAQRFEALVVALWVAADFMMCALSIRCAHEAVRTVFDLPSPDGAPMLSLKGGRFLLWPEAAAVLLTAWAVAPTPERFRLWSETLVPAVMSAFVFVSLPLVWLTGRLRKMLRP